MPHLKDLAYFRSMKPVLQVTYAISAVLLFGCAKPITEHTFPSKNIIPSVSQHELKVSGSASPVKMLYMGCGHLIIEYNGEMIVTDPYFSIQPFSPKKIKISPQDFEKYKAVVAQHGVDPSKAKSVWLAHTHYDHMMDIPLLLEENVLSKKAVIYGNEFGDDILQHFITPTQYHAVLPIERYNPLGKSQSLHWFDSTSSIRVLPILSDHAPHARVLGMNIHLMKGKLRSDYFKKNFGTIEAKTKKSQWREGDVYSFLVDFVKAGQIEYRMFIQTSGSHYPLGLPPADLLKQRSVDVAVLCLASSNYAKGYPEKLLKDVDPKKAVFIHWEDFFIHSEFNNNKLVRLTNFRKLDKRLRKVQTRGTPILQNAVMPQPGTMITIE